MTGARGIKPKFSFGFSLPVVRAGMLRLVFPFKRSWAVILAVGVLFTLLSLPILAGWHMLDFEREQNLFRLVFNIFIIAWMLGWSVGAGILGLVFIGMLLGREVLAARPGAIRIRIEVAGFGLGAEYGADRISNLRTAEPDEKKGAAWRGPHLAFDYAGRTVRFGSLLDGERARAIMGGIETALGARVPSGPLALHDDKTDVFAPAAAEAKSADDSRGPVPDLPGIGIGSPSTQVLLMANLVPLVGVLFLDWRLGDIMVLYWAESAVIAFYTLLRMFVIDRFGAIPSGIFFLGHFGAFMAMHFLFVYMLFVRGIDTPGADMALAPVGAMFVNLWPAIAVLFVSHGVSFRVNFLGRREYAGRGLKDVTSEPYARVMVMHVTIIFGAFIALALHSALPALLLLIGLKTAIDTKAHLRQHGASAVQ